MNSEEESNVLMSQRGLCLTHKPSKWEPESPVYNVQTTNTANEAGKEKQVQEAMGVSSKGIKSNTVTRKEGGLLEQSGKAP